MSNTNKIRITFFGLAILALVWFLINWYNGFLKNKYAIQANMEALQSQLKISYDKQGHQIAENKVLVMAFKDLKNLHVSDSSEIGRLQKIVKKNTLAASIIKTNSSGTLTGHTHVTFRTDTLLNGEHPLTNDSSFTKNPCDTVYPVYTDTLHDKWSNITITATKDSTSAKYTIVNEFEFTQETQKEGTWPFRKKITVVKVKSLNPNTVTTGITSYSVPQPNHKTRNTIIVIGSAVLGFLGALILLK